MDDVAVQIICHACHRTKWANPILVALYEEHEWDHLPAGFDVRETRSYAYSYEWDVTIWDDLDCTIVARMEKYPYMIVGKDTHVLEKYGEDLGEIIELNHSEIISIYITYVV